MDVAILMPVFDEARVLAETLLAIRDASADLGGLCVFIVDDGSEPAIAEQDLPARSASFRIVLARHVVNLGQGAALETARQLALRHEPFDAYVTMDADGQHLASDLPALARAVERGADVAFGDRFAGASRVPVMRRIVLGAARLFERVITGLSLADAHNGFRAFSRRALERIPIRQDGMAHATEIRQRVARASRDASEPLVVVEVPVTVRYSRRTLARGQPSLGAFTILRDLFHRYLFEEPE